MRFVRLLPLVAFGFLGSLFRFFRNLLAEFATLLTSFRSAFLALCARLRLLFILALLVVSGSWLAGLRELNPADNFVGYLCVGIHYDVHRDIEIVATAGRRRL